MGTRRAAAIYSRLVALPGLSGRLWEDPCPAAPVRPAGRPEPACLTRETPSRGRPRAARAARAWGAPGRAGRGRAAPVSRAPSRESARSPERSSGGAAAGGGRRGGGVTRRVRVRVQGGCAGCGVRGRVVGARDGRRCKVALWGACGLGEAVRA